MASLANQLQKRAEEEMNERDVVSKHTSVSLRAPNCFIFDCDALQRKTGRAEENTGSIINRSLV